MGDQEEMAKAMTQGMDYLLLVAGFSKQSMGRHLHVANDVRAVSKRDEDGSPRQGHGDGARHVPNGECEVVCLSFRSPPLASSHVSCIANGGDIAAHMHNFTLCRKITCTL